MCTYTSRHATQVNSNGGSGIPISDWLSPKNQRGILNLSRKSGVIVLNSGVFLQNREFGCYLESRSGNRELRVKSGKSRTNRESWHVCSEFLLNYTSFSLQGSFVLKAPTPWSFSEFLITRSTTGRAGNNNIFIFNN